MLYAGDIAEAAILAANHPDAAGQAFNVTSAGEMTQRELCDTMTAFLDLPRVTATTPLWLAVAFACWSELVGHAIRLQRAPWVTRYGLLLVQRSCRYSTAKAETMLGWKPRLTAQEGVRRTLAWYGETVLGRKPSRAAQFPLGFSSDS